jgi:hypothetical protein
MLTDMADGLELARLTFSLITLSGSGERTLLIGSLQGPSSHSGAGASTKTRIVAATRALSGLRPKMAVFAAASAYVAATGSQSLYAVSNLTHTINADAQYQRRKMHADYPSGSSEAARLTSWALKCPRRSRRDRNVCVVTSSALKWRSWYTGCSNLKVTPRLCYTKLYGCRSLGRAARLRVNSHQGLGETNGRTHWYRPKASIF